MGVNKRLNTFVHDSIFTSHLTLMKCFPDDSMYPLSDTILDRFLQILPKIYHKIQWLNVESSSMEQLHVHVLHFNDCRYLLDGRVNQLGVFRVKSSWIRRSSRLTINNTESLPNMKCFSLYCDTDTLVYDELIVPHFYIEC
ncbi:unnamed protein product [Rotaria sp. Silwood1]|nr:unnamed protein product [Rotaria sp. Silwood1]